MKTIQTELFKIKSKKLDPPAKRYGHYIRMGIKSPYLDKINKWYIHRLFHNFIRKNIAWPAMRPTNKNNPAKQATGGTSGVYGASEFIQPNESKKG